MLQKDIAKGLQVTVETYLNGEKNSFQPEIQFYPQIIKFLGYVPFDTGCKTLGQRIILKRKLLGLSQDHLAYKIGVDPVTIRLWEKGKSKPDRQFLRLLAEFFVNGRVSRTTRRAAQSNRPLLAKYPNQLRTIGDHLRKRRLDLRMTQEEVAEKLGTYTHTIRGWEYNHHSPGIRHMLKIIDFLGYVPWNTLAKILGEKITAYCRLHGITKQELAQQLNIHPCTISRWMAGKRPKKELLQKLVTFLDLNALPGYDKE